MLPAFADLCLVLYSVYYTAYMMRNVSMNLRGQPLLSYETVVNLIGATTTKSGLWVKALLDTREYEPGQKIADDEMHNLRVKPHTFHGDWNYTVQPHRA
jgi:hypothetical protein